MADGLADGVALGEALGEADGVVDGEALGVADRLADGAALGEAVGETLGGASRVTVSIHKWLSRAVIKTDTSVGNVIFDQSVGDTILYTFSKSI